MSLQSYCLTTTVAFVLGLVGLGQPHQGVAGEIGGTIQFNRDIRPILSDQCFSCHGLDAKKRKAGLRLDLSEGATQPNKEGQVAVRAGNLKESQLWQRILSSDPEEVMPPPETHKSLNTEQKELIRSWILQGGSYQKHWAFEPISSPSVPQDLHEYGHPVDAFLRGRLATVGLEASGEADRSTLIRRLSFDLRGLPPTPEESKAYLSDTKPGAYLRLVDRFLAAPQYGEQMARYWLDVARYADTHGLHLDNERQMWAYRDWVVSAFNKNLSFDRFTIEQLAGDLLPNPTQDQQIATGFNRNNITTGEGGAIDSEFIFRYAVDRTATTVQAWMGLTAGCAVCHDHKFDPISQKEFYSLYAFFHSAADPAMDGNALRTPPLVQVKRVDDDVNLAQIDSAIQAEESKSVAALRGVVYVDPADLIPRSEPKEMEAIWFDEGVPIGTKGQPKPLLITSSEGPVKVGKLALKLKGTGLIQEVFEGVNFDVPHSARVFAHVYLDPANAPKLVMLQFYQGTWEHRVIWGDADATVWGQKGTVSRQHAGALPKAGEWVRLEFEAEKLGLKSGEPLTGIAYTQVDGTVYWDKTGISGRIDRANDAATSLAAWVRQYEGKDAKDLTEPVRSIFKATTLVTRTEVQKKVLRDYYLSKVCLETRPIFEPLQGAIAELKKKREQYDAGIPQSFTWRDLEKPRDSFVMIRGQYDKPGDKVTRSTPAAFPQLKSSGALPNRLDLARWLVSDEHPLTARVTVNRFWQQIFGFGLVKTSDDFGSQGEPPSHPELLDWLASDFRRSGWDIKGLVRLLVTSAAYRQSARVSPEVLQKDPENRLLARGPRFRLDAEQLRDNALYVGGLLDSTLGGRGVRPYQPPNIWEPVAYSGSNTRRYTEDTGIGLYRRSLYTFFKRTAPAPAMSTFDVPNREQSCLRRERSNTPLQALQLLNDVQHFEAARGLAVRMMLRGGGTADQRIRYAYQAVLAREPDKAEAEVVQAAFSRFLVRYQADPEGAKKATTFGESKPPLDLSVSDLAAYTLVANLILNLDETVTRN